NYTMEPSQVPICGVLGEVQVTGQKRGSKRSPGISSKRTSGRPDSHWRVRCLPGLSYSPKLMEGAHRKAVIILVTVGHFYSVRRSHHARGRLLLCQANLSGAQENVTIR